MRCPRCDTDNPEVAAYCFRCGAALRAPDATRTGRGGAYAVQAGELVTQFAIVSTILPHTNRRAADSYRWAFLVTAAAVLVFAAAGILPAAIVAGAFLIPITYVIYLYDVNLWQDAPASVVVGVFVFTGAVSVLVSLFFFRWVFDGTFAKFRAGVGFARGGAGALPLDALLVFAVLLPIVAEAVMVVGPVFLASRPAFDDMIDGLTFGIAAGTAYAAAETLVVFTPVITGDVRLSSGLGVWLPIVLNLMLVKPLLYGTATGIAVAAYSGKGEGYDGFTARFLGSFALACIAMIAYWLGVRLFSYVAFGQTLGLIWGVVILAALVLRVRVVLHTALLEAAVEDAAEGRRSKAAVTDSGFCPECEMPLLDGALFCIVCGGSVRATSSMARRTIREPAGGGAA